MAAPRDLDQPLIEAYLARRALDYLVGFTLSPVLWRKLPGSRSAGRVQSVALRLICEREAEIEAFRAREYWTVEADFTTPGRRAVHRAADPSRRQEARPVRPAERADRRCGRSSASRPAASTSARSRSKRVKRNPYAPFTTSTLQQEASRKLGFGAQQTMRLAQQLYEGVDIDGETTGLITYMRTDGVQMAREAIAAIRDHVAASYGAQLPAAAPREYQSKIKNAQEAHEAIRPTDVARTPDSVARFLDERSAPALRTDLEARRGVADAVGRTGSGQRRRDRRQGPHAARHRLDHRVRRLPQAVSRGHRRCGRGGRGPDAAADGGARSAAPRRGDGDQHFTQPPPRYSEASLVKKMEELGIGRPSTYASILSVLQDRKYVRLEKRRFIPEDRGRLVTAFLVSFFEHYVDTGFTAAMEEKLDDISDGNAELAGDDARVLG